MSSALDDQNDIITQLNYDESNPIYQKIKKKFGARLKDKYVCEDFEGILTYVFDFVFKKKSPKKACIENLDSVFGKNVAEEMDFLWKLTRDYEKDQPSLGDSEEDDGNRYGGGNRNYTNNNKKYSSQRNSRGFKGGEKPYRGPLDRQRINERGNKEKYFPKGKRERSRSDSLGRGRDDRERENKFGYEDYQAYPPQPKGFYPPKGRFNRPPMMPVAGPYPGYYAPPPMLGMNPYMQR